MDRVLRTKYGLIVHLKLPTTSLLSNFICLYRQESITAKTHSWFNSKIKGGSRTISSFLLSRKTVLQSIDSDSIHRVWSSLENIPIETGQYGRPSIIQKQKNRRLSIARVDYTVKVKKYITNPLCAICTYAGLIWRVDGLARPQFMHTRTYDALLLFVVSVIRRTPIRSEERLINVDCPLADGGDGSAVFSVHS